MFLLWLLIIGNFIGGFIAASTYIVNRFPKLENTSLTINKFRLPIGIALFLISFLNIFNFWADHYPKLTLIFGLITGFILSVEIFNSVEIDQELKETIFNFANRFAILSGIISILISLVWMLDLLLDVLKIFL